MIDHDTTLTTDSSGLTKAILASLLVVHVLAGCSGNSPDMQDIVEYRDSAQLCVERTTDASPDGANALLRVVFDSCASACATVLESQCAIAVTGKQVSVNSYAKLALGRGDCQTECQVVSTLCSSEALPVQPFELFHGTNTMVVKDIDEHAC